MHFAVLSVDLNHRDKGIGRSSIVDYFTERNAPTVLTFLQGLALPTASDCVSFQKVAYEI